MVDQKFRMGWNKTTCPLLITTSPTDLKHATYSWIHLEGRDSAEIEQSNNNNFKEGYKSHLGELQEGQLQ